MLTMILTILITCLEFLVTHFCLFLFLCFTFFIYKCKFQNVITNYVAFKSFLITKRNVEYSIAKKRGKLSQHFKNGLLNSNFFLLFPGQSVL